MGFTDKLTRRKSKRVRRITRLFTLLYTRFSHHKIISINWICKNVTSRLLTSWIRLFPIKTIYNPWNPQCSNTSCLPWWRRFYADSFILKQKKNYIYFNFHMLSSCGIHAKLMTESSHILYPSKTSVTHKEKNASQKGKLSKCAWPSRF